MNLATATYAFPDIGTESRSQLAAALIEAEIPSNVFVLPTCLRIEVASPDGPAALTQIVATLFRGAADDIKPVVRAGEAATVHLYRVAAGLDSPIVGEREILLQFRQAVRRAEKRGVDGMFAKTLQGAVSSARQVHQMLPPEAHDSIAAVAARLVAEEEHVAILGAGIMASAVADYLVSSPSPPKVTMLARSPERVQIEGVDVWPFSRTAEVLAEMPAVVSATSAKHRILSSSELHEILSRRTEEVVLVDMAMPPDLDPEPSPLVEYIDIDDLAGRADPQPRVTDAEEVACRNASDMFHRHRSHYEVAPLIGSLMATADEIVEDAVSRFAGRLDTETDRAVLRQAAHTVARRLLAGPVAYLNDAGSPEHAIEALTDAFGVAE